MALPQKREKYRYTYCDYVTWPDDERWELMDGKAYDMTPAPTTRHQRIAIRVSTMLESSLQGRGCNVFGAPTDVVLSDYDVVQPDVLVVCDPIKITPANIHGIPDVIFEITSPSTALKDRREKKALYEKHGLKEYVIIEPDSAYAERFLLEADGTFGKSAIFSSGELLPLHALDGLSLALWEVFEVPAPVQSEKETENT